jgi:L-iditol 2-dehydrogenase
LKCVIKDRPEPGIWVKDVPTPQPAVGEVVVRVKRASICGSDIGLYEFSPAYAGFAKLPTIPGHEFTGEVAVLGQGVTQFNVGERVVAESVLSCGNCRFCLNGQTNLCFDLKIFGVHTNGGFAEYVVVPRKHLHRLKDGLSFEQAAIIEPLSVCHHAVHDIAKISPNDTVHVFGPGPIGLLAAQVARVRGCKDVTVSGVDVDETRLGIASKIGFKTIDSSKEDLGEVIHSIHPIVDVAIVAAGSSRALTQACELVRKGGRILNIAIYPKPVDLMVTNLVRREISLLGTFGSNWNNYEEAMELAASHGVALEPLVTHTYTIDDAPAAFENAKAKIGCKVQLVI